MNDTEIKVQRRQTRAFIEADPVSVRFERHTTRRNNRGGTETLDKNYTRPQTVRFLRAILRRNRIALRSTTAGPIARAYDKLVCYPDADIQPGDDFDFEGQRWVVQKLLPRPYEILADVELRDG